MLGHPRGTQPAPPSHGGASGHGWLLAGSCTGGGGEGGLTASPAQAQPQNQSSLLQLKTEERQKPLTQSICNCWSPRQRKEEQIFQKHGSLPAYSHTGDGSCSSFCNDGWYHRSAGQMRYSHLPTAPPVLLLQAVLQVCQRIQAIRGSGWRVSFQITPGATEAETQRS